MTKKYTIKKKAMINALEKTLGVVTAACKSVGISRQTHYRWIEEDETYKNDIEDISEIVLDFAETALYKNIKNLKEASIIFYLKTRAKKRGYIEKQELDMNHNFTGPATINFTDNSKNNKTKS